MSSILLIIIYKNKQRLLMKTKRLSYGFTLIEAVVIIIIIAILAAIAVPRVAVSTADAKIAAIKSTLSRVRQAIQKYLAENPGSTVTPGLIPMLVTHFPQNPAVDSKSICGDTGNCPPDPGVPCLDCGLMDSWGSPPYGWVSSTSAPYFYAIDDAHRGL